MDNKYIISPILFVIVLLMTLVIEVNGMFMSNPYRQMQRYIAAQKAKDSEQKEKEDTSQKPFIYEHDKDIGNRYWMFHPKKTPEQRQKQSEIIRKFNPKPEREKNLRLFQIESALKDNQIFIYQEETIDGIPVDREVAKLSSTIKNQIEDLGDPDKVLIPVKADINTIKSTFHILNYLYNISIQLQKPVNEIIEKPIDNYSFEELIKINNFVHYLDCAETNIEKVYLKAIKDIIDSSKIKLLHTEPFISLNSTLQEKLLLDQRVIDFLKGLMMRYNIKTTEDFYGWGSLYSDRSIYSVAFNPQGTQIAAGTMNLLAAEFTIFDIITKQKIINDRQGSIQSLCYDTTGDNILIGFWRDPVLAMYNVKRRAFTRQFQIHAPVKKVIFSPDNSQVLAGLNSNNNNLLLFNANTGALIQNFTFSPHSESISDIAFSPDGTMILSASKGSENNLKLWTNTGVLIRDFNKDCPGSITSIAFSSNGKKIFVTYITGTISKNTNLIVFDNTGKKEFPLLADVGKWGLKFLLTKDDEIIAWNQKGLLIFITIDDNGIHELTIQQSRGFTKREMDLYSLAISSDGKEIAGGGRDHFARESYVHSWTLLTDNDDKALKNLSHLNIRGEDLNIDHLKLIYQLWLASRKDPDLSYYKMDENEQALFNTLPEYYQRLFK